MNKLLKNLKNGFTLAEVLITLVIIGVIAAMTIPTTIAKYQKEETVSRLKKVYATLLTAYNTAVFEHGDIKNWSFGQPNNIANSVSKYILPYLQVAKFCGTNNRDCTSVDRVTLIGTESVCIKVYSGGFRPFASFQLPDGTILWGYNDDDNYLILAADINGDKGPNKVGRDTFWFVYDKRDNPSDRKFHRAGRAGFYMWGDNNPREYLKGTGADNCNKNASSIVVGAHCGALIKLDGWQIKDDYPW